MQKRKKRRAKGPSRLSFADEVDGDGDTDDDDSEAAGMHFLFLSEFCQPYLHPFHHNMLVGALQ